MEETKLVEWRFWYTLGKRRPVVGMVEVDYYATLATVLEEIQRKIYYSEYKTITKIEKQK